MKIDCYVNDNMILKITGVYRFPIDKAARIALTTVKEFIQEHSFEEVRFVLFSERDLQVYEEGLRIDDCRL